MYSVRIVLCFNYLNVTVYGLTDFLLQSDSYLCPKLSTVNCDKPEQKTGELGQQGDWLATGLTAGLHSRQRRCRYSATMSTQSRHPHSTLSSGYRSSLSIVFK